MNFDIIFNDVRNYFHAGELRQALWVAENLLVSHGERGDTLNMIALCHLHSGDSTAAEAAFRRAVAADPAYAPAWSNFGNLLNSTGHREEGEAALRAAVASDPNLVEGWNNLGLAALTDGKATEAEQLFRRALAIMPDYAVSLFNLARTLLMTHRPAESEAVLRHLLAVSPLYPAAEACLGAALVDQGRIAEGEQAYRRELARDPGHKMALNNLGLIAQKGRRLEEAAGWFAQGVATNPGDGLLLCNHANVLRELGRAERAAAQYRAAALADPALTMAWSKWMLSARSVWDWTDLPVLEERIAANIDIGAEHLENVPAPFDLLIHPTLTGAQHRMVARAYARQTYGSLLHRPMLVPPGQLAARAEPVLRVGYVSSDYFEHATMRLLAGVLAAHDPARVAFVCYSTGAVIGEAERTRIEAAPACAGFYDVARISDEEAAARIHADGIDILVDLKGYTQENRLGIQALRPAPVVVSWLGYPGTLGDPRLADYIIGDRWVTPLGSEADYSEVLALMPHCYQPNDDTFIPGQPPSRASQGLPEEGLILANFNSSYKFSPASFDRWMDLLRQLPGSVLWLLKQGDSSRKRLQGEAAARGIGPDRLVFAPAMSQRDHIARLQLADLALDTFPYTSHTTGSDALLAGVPLVTRPGEIFASRVAASLLDAVGLAELIAPDDEAAYRLTLDLARDHARRMALSAHLRSVRRNCPLFDTPGFARDLERLYRAMADQQVRGERAPIVLAPA
ncbi:MAG TPA: tetratricopeptide repeat protein [Novosphingobium sp.]|nr:tetratricopeptide repeat protein [Novosphingobium sp.]